MIGHPYKFAVQRGAWFVGDGTLTSRLKSNKPSPSPTAPLVSLRLGHLRIILIRQTSSATFPYLGEGLTHAASLHGVRGRLSLPKALMCRRFGKGDPSMRGIVSVFNFCPSGWRFSANILFSLNRISFFHRLTYIEPLSIVFVIQRKGVLWQDTLMYFQ